MDQIKIGRFIAKMRKEGSYTQRQLADMLGISDKTVSKWETGETLSDTVLLADLANVLETSIDYILTGGSCITEFKRKITIDQMREGIECFVRFRELLGKDNLFYTGAVEGVDNKMNIELKQALADPFFKGAMIAEATIQCVLNGAYVDLSDIQKGFQHEHWVKIVAEYAKRYGIK